MLVKVVIDNFMSFEKRTELTMVASNKTTKKKDHKVKIKSTSLLKYAVAYGANASGKSNLVGVFKFIQYCVKKSIPVQASTMFCKNKEENSERDSTFELQFSVGNKFYAYGFSINLRKRKIKEEWLYELYQNGTAKMLFERRDGKKPYLGDKVTLDKLDFSKMETYLEDFDENSDILFLSFMNRGKKYNKDSKIIFFKDVFDWITESLVVATPHTSLTSFEYYYDDDASLTKINKLIKTFDTGITKIKIDEISIEELKNELPEPIFSQVMNDLKEKLEDRSVRNFKMSMRSRDNFFNIESKNGEEIKVTTIKLQHGKSFYDFNFKEESDGTRRLFELLDILLNKIENKVYVIDEMERSLHPKLTERFIKLFDEMHLNQRIQLIFTTHEATIMDQNLFRRDEIWFVEREPDNSSKIYSLDKFKERYDKKLSKAYLNGRYGAIPVFTNFKFEGE